ncbi:hypothetical protein LX36DRAFT_660778 [Colletotrichum falcatum]|nr:hypothetical protein LX36DRAFT_660778 [Colletotrichum falcatum]
MLANALAVAATLASAVAGATVPAPIYSRQSNTTVAAPPFFKLQVVSINTPIHLKHFQATENNIFVGLSNQNASCNIDPSQPTEQEATFAMYSGDGFFLYGGSQKMQQVYSDEGELSYTTYAQSAPPNAGGWAVNELGYLTFNGTEFSACPAGIAGAWNVYVNAGEVASLPNCLPISARAVAIPQPVGCLYNHD